MPTTEVAYDPRVNYWESNPHLRFLVGRALEGEKNLREIIEVLNIAGEVAGKEFAPRTYDNDKVGATLGWRFGTDLLSKEQHEIFMQHRSDKVIPKELEVIVADAVRAYQADGSTPIPEVILSEGSRQTLSRLRELGLVGVTLPKEDGLTKEKEPSLPQIVDGALAYMGFQADAATYTIPGLTAGAAETILRFGSKELQERYIPKLVSSNPKDAFTGAMVLTEPQAGSDVGAIKASAKRDGDTYRISGEKIFITNADADVLIVLARIEGTKEGTNGLSLFLVPKYLEDGRRNRVHITRLEKKMGLHASPTGALTFEGAEGYLIGEENRGFPNMLYLMNRSRLGVGTQGLGIAERALLQSQAYCAERIQFGQTLERLPLMQENLVNMNIEVEAAASLVLKAYGFIDRYFKLQGELENGTATPERQSRFERYQKLVRILTPLAKYRGSELAVKTAERAIDNFGGYGYIKDTGVEQRLREAVITRIYEGTNDIQSLEALKTIPKYGTLDALIQDADENLSMVSDGTLMPYVEKVRHAIQSARDSYQRFGQLGDLFSANIAAQSQARKIAELLTTIYEASLILEEAQHLVTTRQDWRKAVMAIKYINDKLSPESERINTNMTSAKYFDAIVRHVPLSSLN